MPFEITSKEGDIFIGFGVADWQVLNTENSTRVVQLKHREVKHFCSAYLNIYRLFAVF